MSLFKIELYKYMKSKMYISYSIALIVCYMLPILLFQLNNIELNPIYSYHEILQFNAYLTFPFLSILHYSYFLSSEYSMGTIKHLFSSVFTKDRIYITKFLVATITFIIQFVPGTIFSLIYIFLFYKKLNVMVSTGYSAEAYTFFETIGIILIIQLMLLVYFITLGALTMLVNIIIKKRMVTILFTFALIILFKVIPIPPQLTNYTFIDGTAVVGSLLNFRGGMFNSFQITFSSVAFILLFALISMSLFKKQTYQ